LTGKMKHLQKTCPQFHIVYHKSYMKQPRIESRLPGLW
jgi:hypothetical protein